MRSQSRSARWCMAGLIAAAAVLVFQYSTQALGQDPARGVRPDVGTVRGTILWGMGPKDLGRGDSGSDVWVFAGRIELPSDCTVFSSAYEVTIGECDKRNLTIPFLKHVAADYTGRFEVRDLPIGDYTLVIRSAHAGGTDKRDVGRKFAISWFSIKGGDTVESSAKF